MNKQTDVAIVSGASSGLGRAIVLNLVSRGWNVAALARDAKRLESVAQEAGAEFVSVFPCDIGEYEQVRTTANRISNQFSIKHLFNVAGAPAYSKITEIDGKLLDQALSANLRGVVLLTSQCLAQLKLHVPSSVVTVMSTAALTGRPNEGAYTAAKWGARGFMECLKADCKGSGVRAISVFPGGLRTPFWQKESCLRPSLDGFMDPQEVAVPIVDAALGIGAIGYVGSLTIERG